MEWNSLRFFIICFAVYIKRKTDPTHVTWVAIELTTEIITRTQNLVFKGHGYRVHVRLEERCSILCEGGGGVCNYVYTCKKIGENELSDFQTISTQYILNI